MYQVNEGTCLCFLFGKDTERLPYQKSQIPDPLWFQLGTLLLSSDETAKMSFLSTEMASKLPVTLKNKIIDEKKTINISIYAVGGVILPSPTKVGFTCSLHIYHGF